MKKKLFLILISLTSLKSKAQNVFNYFPLADASVYVGSPNTNYGNALLLVKGYANFSRTAYLKFQLPNSNSLSVDRAILKLYCSDKEAEVASTWLYASLNSNAWEENTITWNNKPANISVPYLVPISEVITAKNGYYEFDVTQLVRHALTLGDLVSINISADNGTAGNNLISFASRGNSQTPVLIVSSKSYFGTSVGIKTIDTKGYDLAVGGSIVAESVNIKMQQAWPDYVFHKDYKLMPIDNLKDFIEKNQHLPEMPSEDDVKEHGISLGEVNSKLLKKIEELTLYIINQENRIKILENLKNR